jgi:hypothetical protein
MAGEAALDNSFCLDYTLNMETEYMFHIKK